MIDVSKVPLVFFHRPCKGRRGNSLALCCKALLLCVALMFAGCAPPVVEKKRFFFPPPPSVPRFEYLGFIQSDHDLNKDKIDWVEDALFGRERPFPLFENPFDVSSDGERLFVSDLNLGQVLILDLATGKIRYLQSRKGGDFRFVAPLGVATDAGYVAVADIAAKKIALFSPEEQLLSTISLEKESHPSGLAMDAAAKRIYLADVGFHKIRVYDFSGALLEEWGVRGTKPGEFNYPSDLDLDKDGNLYVLDAMNARVQVFDRAGKFLRSFGERGTEQGSFRVAKGIAVSPSGLVYVTDALSHRFIVFNLEGDYLLTIGGKVRFKDSSILPGGFYMPRGVDADRNDKIWVIDSLNRTLHYFQYLTDDYLEKNPIVPGSVFLPK